MNIHPLYSMLGVWVACSAALWLLPFQLLARPLTPIGVATLAGFIAAFCAGTLLATGSSSRKAPRHSQSTPQSVRRAMRLLAAVSVAAGVCLLADARGSSLFDLVVAYELRSEAANALLQGDASTSSAWFQVGFLLYPACYVYLVAHAIYAPRVRYFRMLLVGVLPIVLATLVMGGRMPIFYAALVLFIALRERKKLTHVGELQEPGRNFFLGKAFRIGATALVMLALIGYFAAVFVIRAEVVGGTREMLIVAEENWGIGFNGTLYPYFAELLGDTGTYMVFVFVWYLTQGLVMGNHILGSYDGPMQLGAYGTDIGSAIVRRLSPDRLSQGFDYLLQQGTYGFLPSAWGSLFVDYGYLGMGGAVLWGSFAGLTWHKIVRQRKVDWLLVGPFVTMGIAFSVINTPFGFTNGLITHFWLLVAFLMIRLHPSGNGTRATQGHLA
jgi:oligosaccharide repeat unit polymerase